LAWTVVKSGERRLGFVYHPFIALIDAVRLDR
jgi:hypothetical protein